LSQEDTSYISPNGIPYPTSSPTFQGDVGLLAGLYSLPLCICSCTVYSHLRKANKLLGFLRRNLKIRNESTKKNAYKAIVRSNLEYCSTVWAPHAKKNKDG
jgi:hypothetical protein